MKFRRWGVILCLHKKHNKNPYRKLYHMVYCFTSRRDFRLAVATQYYIPLEKSYPIGWHSSNVVYPLLECYVLQNIDIVTHSSNTTLNVLQTNCIRTQNNVLLYVIDEGCNTYSLCSKIVLQITIIVTQNNVTAKLLRIGSTL